MADWAGAGLTEEIAEWAASVLGPVDAVEQGKVRPWAAVWQVRRGEESWWAKANCPGQQFEAELVSVLAGLAPAYVVPVTAVDAPRGFLLTPDQGTVFAEHVADGDLDAWTRLVSRAMELARVTADHGAELLATGLTGVRAPEHLVEALLPWQETLGALGLPEAVVHNDLHDHNAFDLPDGLRFFDFADAVWGHPLTTLLVPLNVLSGRLGDPGPDDSRLRRVADAALEVWTDLAPLTELRRALPAALHLARLGRAESWSRIEPHLSREDHAEYGGAAAAWLARLDDPVPVQFA